MKVYSDIAIDEIEKIDVKTERIKKLILRLQQSPIYVSSGRSRVVTRAWKETEGEPIDIRRAKLFQRIMEETPITILEDELIVGSQTEFVRGASPYVDYTPQVALDVLYDQEGEVVFTDEVKNAILEDCEFWKDKAPGDIVRREIAQRFPWLQDWVEVGLIETQQMGWSPPEGRCVDYGKVLAVGLEGVISEAEKELRKIDFSFDPFEAYRRECFLKAVIIACKGAIEYARRYARLAEAMAKEEKNPIRRKELEKIAETCWWVPAKPARNFYEALQRFWLTHLCVNLETASLHEVPGRMDQYLYPYYYKDVIVDKALSRQEAAELLACLWVKFNQMCCIKCKHNRENIPGTHLQQVTIGGVDVKGRDACNELTYLMLHVHSQIVFPQPGLYLRWHNTIRREVWLKALKVAIQRGDGNPAFVNDEVRIPSFLAHGIRLEDARNWGVAGCGGALVPGVSMHGGNLGPNYINLAKVLELVLFRGTDPNTGKRIGIDTGDPLEFDRFDRFIESFKAQFEYLFKKYLEMVRVNTCIETSNYRIPFASALTGDCIQKGKDARLGGTRYPEFLYHFSDRGLQNVADSLAAIKKLVFEEKKVTMQELLSALRNNFEGREDLRRLLLSAPKYGNDDDYVDVIFSELSEWLQQRIGEEKNPYGYKLWTGRSGATIHVIFGRKTGALPDGRKAGEPLADGALSPGQGRDVKGPTAVFNSATKGNHYDNNFAALMNMKFSRRLFSTQEKILKLMHLVETFFVKGGFHIQFNFIDRETLLEAQREPEKHKNLLVRVAGFSAFFVDLPREVQDEIISRTEHEI
ncbi:MAG: pyruvate formate lyase family protein [candidate division WOR-3 bacterium]